MYAATVVVEISISMIDIKENQTTQVKMLITPHTAGLVIKGQGGVTYAVSP